MRGRKAAALGDVGDGALLLLEHIASLFDSNGVQVGDKGAHTAGSSALPKFVL